MLFLFFTFVYGINIQDSLQIDWTDKNQPAEFRLEGMQKTCDLILLRSDPDSAYSLAFEMFKLAEISNNIKYKAEALRIQGESVHFRGDIQQAILLFEESQQLSAKEGYNKGLAKAYSCLGNIYAEQGKYPLAFDYYNRSLEISDDIADITAMANTLIAMGIIYYDQGNALKSLSLFEKALELNRKADDIRGMGRIKNNIGVIYHEQGNYTQALDYFDSAVILFEIAGEKRGMASSLNNIGDLYSSQEKYQEALIFNFKSLEMRKDLEDIRGMANCYNVIGDNYKMQENYQEALSFYLKSAKIREDLDEKRALSKVYGNIGQLYLTQKKYPESLKWCTRAFNLSGSIGAKMEEKESCECLYQVYKAKGEIARALSYHERLMEIEHFLKSEETVKNLQEFEFKKIILQDSVRKEQDKVQVEMKHREEVNQKNKQRNFLLFGGLAILLLSIGLYSRLHYMRKSRTEIQKEKERSDELLLNILPAETASELKIKGFVKARTFDFVTVMFTDFKGFTYLAEKLTAEELVSEIDYCYKAFDQIITRHNIEKIKTIGDSYMCAGGLPIPNQTNPVDVVKAAIEIQEFMFKLKLERIAAKKNYFELRLGIHTGPVVAGIVGIKKFQYDIWGDTVNIASGMETSGEVGKVNISQTTYENVKSRFQCIHRGKVQVKNKGAIDMYFVET